MGVKNSTRNWRRVPRGVLQPEGSFVGFEEGTGALSKGTTCCLDGSRVKLDQSCRWKLGGRLNVSNCEQLLILSSKTAY
ncbi:hypothetical protein TNCV_2382731 [Trichonephila clavipes]|nr:hypothetical protein TNCV_2382731 [Trichonephila clavipes]